MPDDPKQVGKSDRDRINVNEDYELRYWTEKFGVSEERLRAAVSRVGTGAEAVAKALKS